MSVACSGARIDKGLLDAQLSFQKVGQIREVADRLRVPGDHRDHPRFVRDIDILLMSIGGNDCHFAGALSDMTSDNLIIGRLWHGRAQKEVRNTVEAAIRALPAKYDQLAKEIQSTLHPKVVIVTEYPTAMFDRDDHKPGNGCGLFDLTGPAGAIHRLGISASDAAFIEEMGNKLNDVIHAAAGRNGWQVVTGVAAAFKGHGYCSSHPFWRSAEESCNTQDDLEGTMHPNATGARVIAELAGRLVDAELNRLTTKDPAAGVGHPR
jgi:hypothetical protein